VYCLPSFKMCLNVFPCLPL